MPTSSKLSAHAAQAELAVVLMQAASSAYTQI